jgi:hypothetical protein
MVTSRPWMYLRIAVCVFEARFTTDLNALRSENGRWPARLSQR